MRIHREFSNYSPLVIRIFRKDSYFGGVDYFPRP